MSGYRDPASGFDPDAYEQPGPALTPYNWVQWTGVALEVIGIALFLTHIAGKLGWIAEIEPARFGFAPMILGIVLINSRRGPPTQIGREQLDRNKRMLFITLAILALVFALAFAADWAGLLP